MKTAEQITDEAFEKIARKYDVEREGGSESWEVALYWALGEGAPYESVREVVLAAIEADRAQRAEGTVTIELDPEHYPEETVAEVLDQISRGMTSGYYPNWEMHDLERRDG